MGFIEYTNITLKMILDSGLVEAGTCIYSSSQPEVKGKINSDGSITLLLNRQDKVFHSPSGAARAVVKLSVNGWTFWKLLVNNEYKELSFLRKLYKDLLSEA
jgi:hypothetical protein